MTEYERFISDYRARNKEEDEEEKTPSQEAGEELKVSQPEKVDQPSSEYEEFVNSYIEKHREPKKELEQESQKITPDKALLEFTAEKENEEEEKGFWKKVGGFIEKVFYGEEEEGDTRTQWEKAQELFLGIESATSKKKREEKRESIEQLGELEQIPQDRQAEWRNLKMYEYTRDQLDYWDEVLIPYIEQRTGSKEGLAKGYDLVMSDGERDIVDSKTRESIFDPIQKEYYNLNIPALRKTEETLGAELGIHYKSEGLGQQWIERFLGSTAVYDTTDTKTMKGYLEASKKLEKMIREGTGGWEDLTLSEQSHIIAGYGLDLQNQQESPKSLVSAVNQLVGSSIGYGLTMGALVASPTTPQTPESYMTGVSKLLEVTGIKLLEAVGLTPSYDTRTQETYYGMVTPEYAFIVDKVGDVMIEKIQEGAREEGEKAELLAGLGTVLETFSESWGELLGIGEDIVLESLVKTRVFNTFAKWALDRKSKLAIGSLNQVLKGGRFDGLLGEFLEEELLEPLSSLIENREYYGIDTPEGKERMLTELVGFALTGGIGNIQAKNEIKKHMQENKEYIEQQKQKSLETELVAPVEKDTVEKMEQGEIKEGIETEDIYEELKRDIEAQRVKEPEYKEEGDLSIEQLNPEQERELQDIIYKLEADIEEGARKKNITQDQEGEAIISVEGVALPDYIPEELRSRELVQKAIDSIVENKVPTEGTKVWQVYQEILQKAVADAEGVEISEPEVRVVPVKEVVDYLISIGTDDGNGNLEDIAMDDHIVSMVKEADSYELKTVPIQQLLDSDTELAKALKQDPQAYMRDREYEPQEGLYEPIIVDAKGKIIDGYGRINALIEAGESEIDAYIAVEKEKPESTEPKKKETQKKPKTKETLQEFEDRIREERLSNADTEAREIEENALQKELRYLRRKFTDSEGKLNKSQYKKYTEEFMRKSEEERSIEMIKDFLTREGVDFEKDATWRELLELQDQVYAKNLPFRLDKDGTQSLDSSKLSPMTLQEMRAESLRIFGDENVALMERILTPNRMEALGKYSNAWIQIRAGQADVGSTFYHEAVHKGFDIFLTASEKRAMINEVIKKVGRDNLRKEFASRTTTEKLRLAGYWSNALGTYNRYLNTNVNKIGAIGIDQITQKKQELKNKDSLIRNYTEKYDINSNEVYSSVIQVKDEKTKELSYYFIEGEMDAVHAEALIDNTEWGIAGELIEGKTYHLTALKPSILENSYTNIKGKFDLRDLPYSKDASLRSKQREYRNQFGITKNAKEMYRGDTTKNINVDAMAQEWLAENIIDYVNNKSSTTFWGKLKRMVDIFIDRVFKGIDHIKDINDFYDSLLSGKLLERQKKLEAKQRKNWNKYISSIQGAGMKTDAVYRQEVAKKLDVLTTKILKQLEGKTVVKKQFIEDATKQKDIKKIEADIIKDVLKNFPENVEVNTFKEKVLAELLPLNRVKLATDRYEWVSLPDEYRGKDYVYSENIYTSPVMVSAGGKHFGMTIGDMMDDNAWLMKKDVLPSNYYFGHTRVEEINNGKQRRLLEVQSDLYQKGVLEKEAQEQRGLFTGNIYSQDEQLKEWNKKAKKERKLFEKLYQYKDPTAHLRMLREEIRQASLDEIESLLIPTGNTAMYIEQLAGKNTWHKEIVTSAEEMGLEENLVTEKDLKVGKEIFDVSFSPWIITEVLGNKQFRAIEKSWWDLYTNAEVRKEKTNDMWEVYSKYNNKTIERGLSEEEAKQKVVYYTSLKHKQGAIMQGSELFNIASEVDTSNPVYKFYEDLIGKYVKSNYNAKLYKDNRDIEWWKIDIKPEYAEAIEAFRLDELVDYGKVAREYESADAFASAIIAENPDYAMTHRPSYFIEDVGDFTQIMPSASNLLEGDVLPRDVYEHPEWSLSPQHNDIENQESWKAILSVRNKPEADLVVYRASSKEELNVGDWITLSKTYAQNHAQSNGVGLSVHKHTIKAKEAVFAGDDINEFGYYPKDKLKEIWNKAQKDVAKYRIEESAEVTVPLPELISMATELGANIKLQKKFRKASKAGDFTPMNETDSRIRILRTLFEPQGEVVINQKGEEERLPETPEQQMDRIHRIEKVLAHEIGHLFDWFGGEENMTLKRGNILGRIANLKKYTEGEFRELSNKEIRKELKTLTQIWNPFDENSVPKSYKKYRYEAKELYAEAISVFLNQPSLVKQVAPNFYQGFVEYMARKKEVQNEYFAIVDMIKEGNEVQNRVNNMKKAFEVGQGKRMTIDQEKEAYKKQKKWQEAITAIKTGFANQYSPYLDRLRKDWKEKKITLSKLEEAEQLMGDLALKGNDGVKYAQDIQKEFIVPISEAGIDLDTVGEILVLERNLGDRKDLANPQGLVYDYAQETYDKIKQSLNPAQWSLLQEKLSWWRDYNFKLVEEGYRAGVYSKKFFEEIATVNKNTYTPFAVVDYIEDNYVTAGIIQATGTTKGVENPMSTQMLKSISLMRLTAINNAKQDVVKTFMEIHPTEVIKAETIKDSDGRIIGFKRNAELERKGYTQLELLEDGKRTAYYMDKYISAMFDSNMGGIGWDIARFITAPLRMVNRIFKPAVTIGKASFQFYSNPIKDYKRSFTNLTALSGLFDSSNVASRTTKVFGAFTKEWMKNLKRSWNYAGGEIDAVTQKMLDMYVLSSNVKYEDIDIGNEKFRFDPVKNRVVYKGGVNWLESLRDFGSKIPIIKNTVVPMYDFYMRAGGTLEVNSKIAGFQYLSKKVGDEKASFYTRKYVGTPDYMQKGKFTPLTNELVVFSNVGIQAITADANLATSPQTASGYWMSTVIKVVFPKLLMLLGSAILRVPIPDPDDEDKTIWVNPYDYLSEYYKAMYMSFPIGYDQESESFVFVKVPEDEVGAVIGNLIWKMGTYLQGEGMKIEQLGSAIAGLIPFTTGDNPLLSIGRDWLQYAQGRNPYDDFRGRLAINTKKWDEGGITRFTEMLKWSSNEMGLTNFSTYDDSMDTTLEKTMNLPLLERMFEVTNYGLQEKEEWQKAMGKREKNKTLDGYLESYYAQPSDKKLLELQNKYVVAIKGEAPKDGWTGTDKAEETRLKNEFKREVLANSGNKDYTSIAKAGINNDEKLKILNKQQKKMNGQEFTDYLTELVRYEIVKGEMFAEYAKDKELDEKTIYQVVEKSIPVLDANSNDTLLSELRKRDLFTNQQLLELRKKKLLTSSGYSKYIEITERWYNERYKKDTTTTKKKELF